MARKQLSALQAALAFKAAACTVPATARPRVMRLFIMTYLREDNGVQAFASGRYLEAREALVSANMESTLHLDRETYSTVLLDLHIGMRLSTNVEHAYPRL